MIYVQYLMSCHWMIMYMLFFEEIIMHAIPHQFVLFVKIREVMSSAGKLQYDWACNMSFHVFHQVWWLWNIQIHVLTPFVVCRSHFNSSHIQWFILHSTNNEPFVITRSWYAWNFKFYVFISISFNEIRLNNFIFNLIKYILEIFK